MQQESASEHHIISVGISITKYTKYFDDPDLDHGQGLGTNIIDRHPTSLTLLGCS